MFARVTEHYGKVHWINLAYVRSLTVIPAKGGQPQLTDIQLDNSWVAEPCESPRRQRPFWL
jgi:hypothetical protein